MSTNSLAVIEEIKAQPNKEAFLGSFSDHIKKYFYVILEYDKRDHFKLTS